MARRQELVHHEIDCGFHGHSRGIDHQFWSRRGLVLIGDSSEPRHGAGASPPI